MLTVADGCGQRNSCVIPARESERALEMRFIARAWIDNQQNVLESFHLTETIESAINYQQVFPNAYQGNHEYRLKLKIVGWRSIQLDWYNAYAYKYRTRMDNRYES